MARAPSLEATRRSSDLLILICIKCPATRPSSAMPPRIGVRSGLTPLQCHRDVTRHAAGKIDDFDPKLVSAGVEVLRPKLIDLLRHSGQRVFPARLLLIDGAALVRAQLVGKTVNLHLNLAVAHRPLDDLDRAPNGFFIGNSGWLREVIKQRLLFSLGRRVFGGFLGCFVSFRERNFFHVIACGGQQLVGFSCHVSSHFASKCGGSQSLSLSLAGVARRLYNRWSVGGRYNTKPSYWEVRHDR